MEEKKVPLDAVRHPDEFASHEFLPGVATREDVVFDEERTVPAVPVPVAHGERRPRAAEALEIRLVGSEAADEPPVFALLLREEDGAGEARELGPAGDVEPVRDEAGQPRAGVLLGSIDDHRFVVEKIKAPSRQEKASGGYRSPSGLDGAPSHTEGCRWVTEPVLSPHSR